MSADQPATSTTTTPRLLLIDGHSMAYRAFYALPVENFATSSGQPTNAVFGFVSMLANLLRDEDPTHVAVAFDAGRTTFRTERLESYKGNRAATPEPFRGQVDVIKQLLATMHVQVLDKPGFEADDILATLTTQAREQGMHVAICSGDRDSFQLVSETVTVLYPVRGVSEMARMTPEAVEAKYGVPPERYPDLAALVGETSDNLPGVPGVGPKTAAKWIGQHDGLAGVLANAERITGKAGESLRAHVEQVALNRELNRLLVDLELPLQEVLARMERTGIAIDHDDLVSLEREFDGQVQAAAADAYAVIGREVNLGSPKQLQEVLFDQLGMPKTKRIKTGYTTDAAALTDLFARTGHPFLEHLLAHRDTIRLRQTVEGLLRSIGDDGRIHTTFQQTIAATGRLSSADPNLQNIPIRTEAGRQIRRTFVVGPGYATLLTADYSQIEMRIMAHLSGDEGLIAAFRSGEDLHSYVGSRVFGVPTDEVTSAMRSKIKAMSYGLAYGLSSYGLSQQLSIEVGEASALMADYFERFGGVRDYLTGVVDQARATGYTATILGRRRYLPDLTSDNRQRRETAERMALNAPIQGSAADLIKVAMLGVDRELTRRGLASRMLLQVHDELVLEVADGEQDEVEALVRESMARAGDGLPGGPLDVPLDVSVGVGTSWHAAGH